MFKKYLQIVGVIVLLIALVAISVAFTLPSEVTQEKSLLSYQQAGSFSYNVYLKPSTLYDSPPPATYPIEIVRGLDFNFNLKAWAGTAPDVAIYALLENPGVWQKRTVLVSRTAASSPVLFTVDLDAIRATFETIETETGLALGSGGSRQVVIEAAIYSPAGDSVHRLDIDLTTTLLTVGNTLKQGQVAGESSFNYVVQLKPNSIYDTPTLNAPDGGTAATLGPNEPILIRIASEMKLAYRWDFTPDQPVNNLSAAADITAVLTATNMWTKTFPLYRAEQHGGYGVTLSLDLAAYDALIEAVRTETGVSTDSYELNIIATTRVRGDSAYGPVVETFTHTMKGAISRNVLTWDKATLQKTETGGITQTEVVPNDAKYMGLNLGEMRTVSVSLALVAALVVVGSLVIFPPPKPLWRRSEASSPQDKEAVGARKKLKDVIVDLPWMPQIKDESVVPISSLTELVNVAQVLMKPIMHWGGSGWHIYVVVDGDIVYRYIPLGEGKTPPAQGSK